MPWLKSVLLDIVCTVLIAIAVTVSADWVRGVRIFIMIYTPLMLVLKLVALGVKPGTLRAAGTKKRLDNAAPPLFFHVLYGANVLLLLWGQWWIMAAAWAAIWILSFVYDRRMRAARS